LTVEAWFRVPIANNLFNGENPIVGTWTGDSTGYEILLDAPNVPAYSASFFLTDSANNFYSCNGGPSLNDGVEHHVALTYSSTGTLKGFVDGVFVCIDNPGSGSDLSNGNNDFFFARDNEAAPQFSAIALRQVRISNFVRYTPSSNTPPLPALSPYYRPLVDSNTVALWRINEGSGLVLHDATGNASHNATIAGTPLPTWITNGVPQEWLIESTTPAVWLVPSP
jgi:hypothetical protein